MWSMSETGARRTVTPKSECLAPNSAVRSPKPPPVLEEISFNRDAVHHCSKGPLSCSGQRLVLARAPRPDTAQKPAQTEPPSPDTPAICSAAGTRRMRRPPAKPKGHSPPSVP